ncbi:hypothetical protein JB92DRAFT_2928308 [Gautieria morchelliformis]|nr:hypothetical protein JB92DRAFT_2928308 [Gautieria morchelliformis]
MIRALNKPLLKEWTTAQALKPIPNRSRSFSRCRRNILIRPSPTISFPYASLSIARIANARYSTLPDETNVKTKGIPPPSTSVPPRKPKVDLRPAPKTLKAEPRGTTQPSRPVKPAIREDSAATSSAPSSSPEASTSTGSKPEGLLQATQSDILDATKRGILSPPPEDTSKLGRLWHNLKQLFYFYARGIKMIFVTHRRQASAIQRRVQEAQARGEQASMTRSETRFVQTYRMDLVKLLPFVLTIVVLEEALPFVVLYLPGLLPSTCLLPSQHERIEAKRREKQVAHVTIAKLELERLKSQRQHDTFVEGNGLESLNGELTRAVSGILARSTWGPVLLQRHRIAKYLTHIANDDALLVKEGMGSGLKAEELVEALEERGFIVNPTTPQDMLQQLQWWLKGATDDKARIRLVLQAASSNSK